MQSIKDIKQLFEQAEKEQWNALFSQYKTDERAGVQKLITPVSYTHLRAHET